ncbi:MAG: HAD-IC family P-type ATPase [Candidatus Omnitrophica bacterium]|nr:HAD-IC family P-type ATPase [Candidatus Omnitrophota bacterium]
MPAEEVARLLETHADRGLDTSSIEERMGRFGANRITAQKGEPAWLRFLKQFAQPLVVILLAASGITILLKEWVDGLVIFGVVLVNAIIGFVQESRALKAIDALSRSIVSTATVLRSGHKESIDASGLVPGDIVFLQSGDRASADMRLLSAKNLAADESALTGESVPSVKNVGVLAETTALADRVNMVYSGSFVASRSGAGIVVATGDSTEIGRINKLISETDVLETPLTQKIAPFSHVILYAILALAGATFAIGMLRGEAAVDMFMASVALAVGAIPEGLPAALTITLAIGVSRMARRNTIIRRLPAVETLGSTTVICSDKTGTLTQNQMTVRLVHTPAGDYEVTGSGYDSKTGQITRDSQAVAAKDDAALAAVLRTGLICSDTRIKETDDGFKVEGDPTDAALLVSAAKGGVTADDYRVFDTIPFESEHQYMAVLAGQDSPEGSRTLFVKGSLEAIQARCGAATGNGGGSGASDADRSQKAAADMARQGLRVLAFAQKSMPDNTQTIAKKDLEGGFEFVGIQGMFDPPRPEAIRAIATCCRAGIRVKMITGDHAVTAEAIASQMGVGCRGAQAGSGVSVLSSADLEGLSDEELVRAAEATDVFARVTPEQKLRLRCLIHYSKFSKPCK